MEMKVNNEDQQRKSTMKINENKRVNNEEDHHQWNSSKNRNHRRSSTRKSSHVWNENQHGERQLSTMIITQRKSSYSMWNEQGIVSGVKEWCV